MKRGFTLLEVMVALVIFSLAAIATLQTTSGQTNALFVLQEKMLAGWIADNQMALVALMPASHRNQTHSGRTEMDSREWFWRSVPVATQSSLLLAIEVEVSLKNDFSSSIVMRRVYFRASDQNPGGIL